ncbi:MAG: transglutaminase domain-containing protein [Pirellulales bacterium]|nr:transglutaminase domain-containing protein [Pirellulales bacterium]
MSLMSQPAPPAWKRALLPGAFFLGILSCLALGCTPSSPDESGNKAKNKPGNKATTSPEVARPKQPSDPNDREIWEVAFMQGHRVGYNRYRRRPATYLGAPAIRIQQLVRLSVVRQGQPIEVDMKSDSYETPDGHLIAFNYSMNQGALPIRVEGRVEGDRLVMKTTAQGRVGERSIAWSVENGGLNAVEESLRRKPMTPGQARRVLALEPALDQIVPVAVTLTARRIESVALRADTEKLLRINAEFESPRGQKMEQVFWVDSSGEILKRFAPDLMLETYRSTKEEAIHPKAQARVDMIEISMVRIDRALPHPHATRRVRYRVQLDRDDPATRLPSGGAQQVRSIDPHTAEVTVLALRPEPGKTPAADADRPDPADLAPNEKIQSDDPVIVAMAQKATAGQTTPWSKAVALERYVHDWVEQKDFSQVFASASEVARSRQGDCTEHAVLLAALARAAGIPARVVAGLVYVEPRQAFANHMWTEVYVDGQWIPLDATLGQGGIGAAHLKINHSNLKDDSILDCLMDVAKLLGQTHIEILDVEPKEE